MRARFARMGAWRQGSALAHSRISPPIYPLPRLSLLRAVFLGRKSRGREAAGHDGAKGQAGPRLAALAAPVDSVLCLRSASPASSKPWGIRTYAARAPRMTHEGVMNPCNTCSAQERERWTRDRCSTRPRPAQHDTSILSYIIPSITPFLLQVPCPCT